MTVGLEDYVVSEFIYNALSADGALTAAAPGGIFDGVAPFETVGPWVAFNPWVQAADIRGTGTIRLGSDGLWVVRGVTVGESYAPLKTIAARIDALLHEAPVTTVSDGEVWSSWRQMPFSMEEVRGGQQYRHRGGIYRIFAKGI